MDKSRSVGFQDTKNITGRLREGYELVRSEEVENASDYPVLDDGQIQGSDWGWWPSTCEGTERDRKQRQEYMSNRHKQRDEAVKTIL